MDVSRHTRRPASEVADVLERFIRRSFRVVDDDPGFSRDAHLFEAGYVDSVGVVELMAFIASTFSVALEDDDIFSDAFTTINGMSSLVAARGQAT
jgi:acyl carrier protein